MHAGTLKHRHNTPTQWHHVKFRMCDTRTFQTKEASLRVFVRHSNVLQSPLVRICVDGAGTAGSCAGGGVQQVLQFCLCSAASSSVLFVQCNKFFSSVCAVQQVLQFCLCSAASSAVLFGGAASSAVLFGGAASFAVLFVQCSKFCSSVCAVQQVLQFCLCSAASSAVLFGGAARFAVLFGGAASSAVLFVQCSKFFSSVCAVQQVLQFCLCSAASSAVLFVQCSKFCGSVCAVQQVLQFCLCGAASFVVLFGGAASSAVLFVQCSKFCSSVLQCSKF